MKLRWDYAHSYHLNKRSYNFHHCRCIVTSHGTYSNPLYIHLYWHIPYRHQNSLSSRSKFQYLQYFSKIWDFCLTKILHCMCSWSRMENSYNRHSHDSCEDQTNYIRRCRYNQSQFRYSLCDRSSNRYRGYSNNHCQRGTYLSLVTSYQQLSIK